MDEKTKQAVNDVGRYFGFHSISFLVYGEALHYVFVLYFFQVITLMAAANFSTFCLNLGFSLRIVPTVISMPVIAKI